MVGGIFRLLSEQGFKAYSINNDYSAANCEAPAKFTPLTNLRLHSMTDVFFLVDDRPTGFRNSLLLSERPSRRR